MHQKEVIVGDVHRGHVQAAFPRLCETIVQYVLRRPTPRSRTVNSERPGD